GLITLECLPPHIAGASNRAENIPAESGSVHDSLIADRPTMDELERRYLELVLSETQGNRRAAANVLGIDRRTIQRLIARYRLEAETEDDPNERSPEIPG